MLLSIPRFAHDTRTLQRETYLANHLRHSFLLPVLIPLPDVSSSSPTSPQDSTVEAVEVSSLLASRRIYLLKSGGVFGKRDGSYLVSAVCPYNERIYASESMNATEVPWTRLESCQTYGRGA